MKKVSKWFAVLVCLAILIVGYMPMASAESLRIDDFEDGDKPNLLGGDFGSWDRDPNDLTQSCKMSFYTEPDTNVCLLLKYDVDSPNPAYNGFWMFLQGQDLRKYTSLHISVRGDAQAGFTNRIKLELKNDKKEVGRYLLTGIKDFWQDFTIPLTNFSGISDHSKVIEFVVVFDDINSTVKDGAIYIDDISFD